jgi:glycosyltransferase involved in cell wall biosynthesis
MMPRRVLVVSNHRIGSRMAGPGIRYYNFARELAKTHVVTLVAPEAVDIPVDGVEVVEAETYSAGAFPGYAAQFDVLVAQNLRPWTMRTLAKAPIRVIYDLYDPFLIENLGLFAVQETSRRYQDSLLRANSLAQEVALATGDAFLCASERQRDLWLGVLGSLGRLNRDEYERDPSFRSLIDVVPFGLPADPPAKRGRALKGVVPGIGAGDRVLLWGGGIWNWFDPLTPIRAVAQLAERRDDVKLYFLGVQHPNPETEEMGMDAAAVELAKELGVYDRFVFFNFGWVPYEQRADFLLEADVGISAHFENIETRFAFRTRMLDYLWAGLPIITTRGDVLGELVEEQTLGRVVGDGDVDGWVAAIEELLDDEREHRAAGRHIAQVRPRYQWPTVIGALERLVSAESETRAVSSAGKVIRYVWMSAVAGVVKRGFRGAFAQALQMVRKPRLP